jgi:toxin CcdB
VAQYDVYPNPSRSAADGIPFVVVIQSDLLDALPTRMVVPLADAQSEQTKAPAALCPTITVNGQRLLALAHFAAPLPAKALRQPVTNVATLASVFVAAIDAVLSGF